MGAVTQQELPNSYKVHNLGDAKERSNDQRPARGPLEESCWTLFLQDFPAMEKKAQDEHHLRQLFTQNNWDAALLEFLKIR